MGNSRAESLQLGRTSAPSLYESLLPIKDHIRNHDIRNHIRNVLRPYSDGFCVYIELPIEFSGEFEIIIKMISMNL